MAVGGMGDALLYAYLPVKGAALGMSVLTIGFLLSVNKFTRFFTNRWMAYLATLWGVKNVLLLGGVLAAATTLVYAFNPALWIWGLSRVIWGLSYSSLRLSTIEYAGKSGRTGSALGVGRSIQEAGPLLAYWIGPLMINTLGAPVTFTSWAIGTLLLLPALHRLPDLKAPGQNIAPLTFQRPALADTWVFASSFAVEGILVVSMSQLLHFEQGNVASLMTLSALYISFRRLAGMVLAPLSGWVSDRMGFKRVFGISAAFTIAGIFAIAAGFPGTGICIAFIGAAANMTLVPVIAMEFSHTRNRLNTLTRLNTSRDMGSAVGSLTGLYVLSLFSTGGLFAVIGIILTFIWFFFRKSDHTHEQHHSYSTSVR